MQNTGSETLSGSIRRRPRPPAPLPRRSPIVEEPFGTVRLVMALRRNLIETWTERHFEDLVLSGRSPLLGHVTVVSDPALVRAVLVERAENYPKDRLQRRVLAPGLGDGLLTAEGATWKRTRRILAPLFTPRAVAAHAGTMTAVADRAVARWLKRPDGTLFDMAEEMTRVTFDILRATLFSNGIQAEADSFARAMTRYFEAIGRIDPLDLLDAPGWIPRVGRIVAEPAIRFFETEVARIVAARRDLIARDPAGAPPDLLTALLRAADPETGEALTEAEVGANIITFIGAGHETTANALTWTLYLLARHPDVRDAIEAEVDAFAGDPADVVDRLPWTRAAFEEAMRLYPPVTFIGRQAVAADRIGPAEVPAGGIVVMSNWVRHRHRKLWDEPDLFRPERFLPGARETIDRFAWLPFGAGPRVCIGTGFAMTEGLAVLAAIARRCRLDFVGRDEPWPVQRITLRPRGGMPMRVTRRG